MLSVYGERCLSHKAVRNWVEKFNKGRSHLDDDERTGRPVEIATDGRCGESSGRPHQKQSKAEFS